MLPGLVTTRQVREQDHPEHVVGYFHMGGGRGQYAQALYPSVRKFSGRWSGSKTAGFCPFDGDRRT